MRIAMVAACPFPSYQGSQVFIRGSCDALARRGHEIELLTYGEGSDEIRSEPTGYMHHRIRRSPSGDAFRSGPTGTKLLLDGRLARALGQLLRRREFDVVHCHNYEAAAVGALVRMLRRVPTVYHSHGLLEEELPTYLGGSTVRKGARAVGHLFDRYVPRAVDHTIVLSDDDATRLEQHGLPSGRSTVAPPALDDPGEPGSRAFARSTLGLDPRRFVVGYAGNLDKYQNLDVLARAIARLGARRAGRPPLWLVITHRPEPHFHAMLAATGAAPWTRILEVSAFSGTRQGMAACDVLISPRQVRSGLPIKLVNYLAAGRAVVAAAGGFGLLRDGEDGLSVGELGDESLSAALCRLADDSALGERLARAARRRFLAGFTWEVAAPVLERVYAAVTDAWRAADTARAMLR